MMKFKDFKNAKVLHEGASQKHRIHMKRPTPYFKDVEGLELPTPAKLSSKETEIELQEVMDSMIMSPERLAYEVKLDEDYLEMMKDIVGRSDFDVALVGELKRQIDTLTLRQKYHFNRLRPRETARFYGKVLVPHVHVDTPSYPSNHTAVGFVVAEVLSRRHPDKKEALYKVAEDNAQSRISLGVHFPEDIDAGKDFFKQLMDRYITQEPPKEEEVKQLRYKDLPAPVYGMEGY